MSTPKLANADAPDDGVANAPESASTATLPVREPRLAPPSQIWSQRRASLIGGVALLLLAVVAGLANFGAVEALVTPGDAPGRRRISSRLRPFSDGASPA